jgi:hypothetical protein
MLRYKYAHTEHVAFHAHTRRHTPTQVQVQVQVQYAF